MNNRGSFYSLSEKDVNCLKPNKKTYHTIIPGFITKSDNINIGGPFGSKSKLFLKNYQITQH